MSDQEIMQVICMLFLGPWNSLQHHPRGCIIIAEIANELPVMLDGNPLGDQIFADHIDEIFAFGVFGGKARRLLWLSLKKVSDFES